MKDKANKTGEGEREREREREREMIMPTPFSALPRHSAVSVVPKS